MKKALMTLLLALTLCLLPCLAPEAAAKDLDEIERYEISVSVNEDGSLNILYDIAWRVLDSDSEGPLEWVKVGIPNRHYRSISLSDHPGAAVKAGYLSDGGSYARVDLDRKYYAGEVAEFSFLVVQE